MNKCFCTPAKIRFLSPFLSLLYIGLFFLNIPGANAEEFRPFEIRIDGPANCREKATVVNSKIVASIADGMRINALDKKGDWYKIEYLSDICWTNKKNIRPETLLSPEAYFPSGCFPRSVYSKAIVKNAPIVGNRGSGLGVACGVRPEEQKNDAYTRVFSLAEFEKILARPVTEYSAGFNCVIESCRDREDGLVLSAEEKNAAIKKSSYKSDVKIAEKLSKRLGEWCGRAPSTMGKHGWAPTEIVIQFYESNEMVLARGTIAYAAVINEPVGKEKYVSHFDAIPDSIDGNIMKFVLIDSNGSESIATYSLREETWSEDMGVFPLPRNCKGYKSFTNSKKGN